MEEEDLLIPSFERSKSRRSCSVASYRVLVVSLLFAILGLQIANLLTTLSKDNQAKSTSKCKSAGIATLIEKLGGPLDMSGLPQTCGSLQPLPERLLKSQFELKQVQVVIRHGDRTQWKPTPCPGSTATWNCSLSILSTPGFARSQSEIDVPRIFRHYYLSSGEPIPGDCPIGQLTMTGFHQEVQNGIYLRQAYVNDPFLNASYNQSEIYIRSDDEPRTIQSAEGLFYGLYPPDFCTQQPVDVVNIHMLDINHDYISQDENGCPKFSVLVNESHYSQDYINHFANTTEPLLQELSQKLNTTFTSADDLDSLVDCFRVHLCHRFSLPPGISEDLAQRAGEEMTWIYNYQYTYPSREIGCKAAIGYVAKDIYDRMNDFITGKNRTKFILYSGHDTTILPLLNLFQLENAWPPYASRLTFELYEEVNNRGTYQVRVLYNGNIMKLPFCNNESLCSWKTTFGPYVQKFIPTKEFCLN